MQSNRQAKSLVWGLSLVLLAATIFLVLQNLRLPKFVVLPGNLLASEFAESTTDGAPPDERTVSTNQSYEFNGRRYGVGIELAEAGLPYLAGSSVAGRAYFTENDRQISRLPQAVVNHFAPNRSGEPILLYLCVRTSVDETARNLRDVNPIAVRNYRAPAVSSFVFSTQAQPATEGMASTSRANCVPPLDMSSGQADFEIFTNGSRSFTSARVEGHVSVGPLVGQAIAERLTFASFYKTWEFADRLGSRLAMPSPNYRAVEDGSYTIHFDKHFVGRGAKQMVGVEIIARGNVADGRVALIAHPLRHYWVVDEKKIESSGQFPLDGHLLIEESVSRHQIAKPRGDYSQYGDVIELDLENGRATAYFEYNGGEGLLPYIAFTAMPANRLGDIESISGGGPYAHTTKALPIGAFGGRIFPWLAWLCVGLSLQLGLGLLWRKYWRKKLGRRAKAKL